jgi:hypothetical protein
MAKRGHYGLCAVRDRKRWPVLPKQVHRRTDGAAAVWLSGAWRMARPGRVTVTFGAPLDLKGQDYSNLARQVEEAVKRL